MLGWSAFTTALAAFVLCWLPVIDLTLGVVALALSVLALFRQRPAWMGLLGLILGALASVTGLVVTIGLIALLNLPGS